MSNVETKPRPLPRPRVIDREYWEGTRQGELRLQQCNNCSEWRFPPEPRCPVCLSRDFTWKKTTGRGVVWSWIVMHRNYFPGLADQLPYNVALIELEEGPWIMSNIDGPNDSIEIGMTVEVVFEEITDEFTLPRFRALDETGA